MPYRIYKDGNDIALAVSINIQSSGVLEAADANHGVDSYFAPGAWDSAHWEEADDAS